MSLFKELNPVLKYLKQIRNIEGYIIFDMHFPATWKILKKFIINDNDVFKISFQHKGVPFFEYQYEYDNNADIN